MRPYYLYACDLIEGSGHLRVPVARGIELIRSLRGHTTGFAVPQYVIDAPGGGGKVPVNPEYVEAVREGWVQLRNYEDRPFRYPSGEARPSPLPAQEA